MKPRWCFVLLLLCAPPLRADAPANLLRNPDFVGGLQDWFLKGADRCKSEVVLATNEKFERALRLDVTPQAKDMPWSVVLRQTIGAPLQKGKLLTLKVWLRSPEQVQVTAFVEGAAAPYPKTLSATLALTPQWQEYEIKSECNQDFGPGDANCGFFLAHGKGSIRMAGVRLFQTDKPVEAKPTPTPTAKPTPTPRLRPTPTPLPPQGPPEEVPLANGDFTQGLTGWTRDDNSPLKASVVEAQAGPFTRALKLESDAPADETPFAPASLLKQKIAAPLRRGDGLQIKFWLHGPAGARLGVLIGPPASSATFLRQVVRATAEWKEVEMRGVSYWDSLPQMTQNMPQIALWASTQGGALEVAGLRLTRVPYASREWLLPPREFNVANLFKSDMLEGAVLEKNSPFSLYQLTGWMIEPRDGCQVELVDVEAGQAGPYRRALRLTFTSPDGKNRGQTLFQAFETPPLTNEVFALKFWANCSTNSVVQIFADQSEKYVPPPPGEKPTPPRTRPALAGFLQLTPGWKEYVWRPNPLLLERLKTQPPMTTERATCRFIFAQPEGVVELTGMRLGLERLPE